MEVFEPEIVPDPPGTPEHGAVHRPVRDLAHLPSNTPIAPLPHPATPRWTKTADDILETLAAYCQRIVDSGH